MLQRIGIIVGSERKGSYSRSIAEALVGYMGGRVESVYIDIGNLPMFSQDYDDEGNTPGEWVKFRELIGEMDGFLFVTPEYNRSFPAVIKNALDIASRPQGQNLWSGKPGAIVSVSPGRIGGFGANHHLRQCASFLNIFMMQQPEAYVGEVTGMLDENGRVAGERAERFLRGIADGVVDWMRRFSRG